MNQQCQWTGCNNAAERLAPTGNPRSSTMWECGRPDCGRYRYAAPVVQEGECGHTLIRPGRRGGVPLVPAGCIVPDGLIRNGTEVIQQFVGELHGQPIMRERRVSWPGDEIIRTGSRDLADDDMLTVQPSKATGALVYTVQVHGPQLGNVAVDVAWNGERITHPVDMRFEELNRHISTSSAEYLNKFSRHPDKPGYRRAAFIAG